MIKSGEEISSILKLPNLKFKYIDVFDIDDMKDHYDGVISLQTLSFLSEFQKPLDEIFNKIKPAWIGISSLFYEGNISSFVDIIEHNEDNYSHM